MMPPAPFSPFEHDRAADDVSWRRWGEDPLKTAADQNKPLMLFIGYGGCGWTRAMAETCFQREDIAAAIHECFVPVLIDAQVYPDVDLAYQASAQALGLQGGWPLLLFAKPDGMPFWGVTYVTPDGQGDQPGLFDVLSAMETAWHDNRDEVDANADIAREQVVARFSTPSAGSFDAALIDQIAPTFMARMDLEHGGITGAPKFPNTPYFERLWRAYLRTGKADYAAAVQLSYTMMSQGALYDHIGGGFFRYSMDGEWKTPDPEKTLYDNALILKALCHLHGNVPQRLYAAKILETADFLCQSLVLNDGSMASALGAPDDPEAYQLSAETITDKVGGRFSAEDITKFCEAYSIGADPLPHRLNALEESAPKAEMTHAAIAAELAISRSEMTADLRSTLSITSWTMLAVTALVHAGKLLQRDRFLDQARRSFAALVPHTQAAQALAHCQTPDGLGPAALLDDIAAAGLAAITLACADNDPAYLTIAQALADRLLSDFQDDSGAFFMSEAPTPFGPIFPITDQPIPSGNAMAIRFLSQLSRLVGAPRYQDAAWQAVAALSGEINKNFMGLASFLAACEDMDDPIDVAWTPADYDSETITWAVAPPGALIIPPALHAGHIAAPIQAASQTKGIILCRKDSQSAALTDRDNAIDALRNAKRVATEEVGAMLS